MALDAKTSNENDAMEQRHVSGPMLYSVKLLRATLLAAGEQRIRSSGKLVRNGKT